VDADNIIEPTKTTSNLGMAMPPGNEIVYEKSI
jgi:hypothetical protein